jgi:transcriptional regulator with XRE-family HTH domain
MEKQRGFLDENFGKSLRRKRKSMGLSIAMVCEILKRDYGMTVAEKTIYGWENGTCYPPLEKFYVLCQIYNISNIFEMSGEKNKDKFALYPEEKQIILSYRRNIELQYAVRKLLDIKTNTGKENE